MTQVRSTFGAKPYHEGYVYNSYGDEKYLKHVIASIETLRRYDSHRPVALFCSAAHRNILEQKGLSHWFDAIDTLPEEHQSITGFKHNVYEYMPFEKNLYLDSDMIWCRDPDRLWELFAPYEFTITGNQVADIFFGAPKNIAILKDILLFRRRRTLRRMNISHLVRVQSGMMYASSPAKTREVCELAKEFLSRQNLTHFRSRKEEKGRSHESCEWSFALALVKLNIQVFPWLNGYDSPQLDYIDAYTGT
jgi:hypothetical protein